AVEVVRVDTALLHVHRAAHVRGPVAAATRAVDVGGDRHAGARVGGVARAGARGLPRRQRERAAPRAATDRVRGGDPEPVGRAVRQTRDGAATGRGTAGGDRAPRAARVPLHHVAGDRGPVAAGRGPADRHLPRGGGPADGRLGGDRARLRAHLGRRRRLPRG